MALIPVGSNSRFLGLVARWWRDWKHARANLFDLENCSEDEFKRIARYLHVSATELRWIASYSPDRAEFLRLRMAELHLEPHELARCEPAKFRELVTLCATCDSRGRCALDLADEFADPGWQNWRDYCPNATTLSVLSAVQCCSSEPTLNAGSGEEME